MKRALAFAVLVAALLTVMACGRPAVERPTPVTPLLGTRQISTSRQDLDRTIATMSAKVAAAPGDAASAVTLADALLRQTRVTGNAGLAKEAERVLLAVLERDEQRYD